MVMRQRPVRYSTSWVITFISWEDRILIQLFRAVSANLDDRIKNADQ